MFLVFLVVLISGAAICIALFSCVEIFGIPGLAVPGNAPLSLYRRVAGTGQVLVRAYVWLGWAAYCAWFALVFGSEPGAPSPWAYYVTAIAASAVPVAYLKFRDRGESALTDEERTRLQEASNLWRLLIFFSCATFLIVPQLMTVPYGWLGHANRLVARASAGHLATRLHIAQEDAFSHTNSGAITPLGAEVGNAPTMRAVASGWRVTDVPDPASADETNCQNERLNEDSLQIDGALSPCVS